MLIKMETASGGGGGGGSLAGITLFKQSFIEANNSSAAAYPYGTYFANIIGIDTVKFTTTYACDVYGWKNGIATKIVTTVANTQTADLDVSEYDILSAIRSVNTATYIQDFIVVA